MTLILLQSALHSNLNTILIFVVSSLVGLVVWFIQKRATDKTAAKLLIAQRAETARIEEARVIAEAKLNEEKERRRKLANSHSAVLSRLDAIEKDGRADSQQLALLKQEMLPMSEFMKRKFIDALMHPSDEFQIPDALLQQVKAVGAPMPHELERYLQERKESKSPHVGEYEKLAAEGLGVAVRMAEFEALHPELEVTGMQLVSSTIKSPETKRQEENS